MIQILDHTREVFNIDKSTLNIDIENTPTLAWAYQSYEARVFDPEEYFNIQSIALAWGDGPVEVKALPDFPLYKKDPHNDKELIEWAYNEMKKASLIVGHNVIKFDLPKLKLKFMKHGLSPLPKVPVKDTLRMARQYGFFSKSLDSLAKEMGLEGKEEMGVAELWKKCYEGKNDKKWWPLYKKYNKRDVELDRLIYRKLVSWEPNMPRLSPTDDCPVCNSSPSKWKKNGMKYGRGWEQQRYACLVCGNANLYGQKYKLDGDISI